MGRVHLDVGAQERLDRPGAGDGALEPGEPAAEARVAGAAGGEHGGHGLGPPALVELGQQRSLLGTTSSRTAVRSWA